MDRFGILLGFDGRVYGGQAMSWDYYTVTLNNTKHESGIVSGSIEYSEIMCGDCIRPASECGCSSNKTTLISVSEVKR